MKAYVKFFLCVYWDNHVIFGFYSISMTYYINWFLEVKPNYIPGIKSILS